MNNNNNNKGFLRLLVTFLGIIILGPHHRGGGDGATTPERIVTIIKPGGEPVDFRYSESHPLLNKQYVNTEISAPGCPKSIGRHPWLRSSEKPPRCYLAETRGPCWHDAPWFLPFAENPRDPVGVCYKSVEEYKRRHAEELRRTCEKHYCGHGHVSGSILSNGRCPPGETYSVWRESCSKALSLSGGIG